MEPKPNPREDSYFFHLFGRGNHQERIVLDDKDRAAFLYYLGRVVRRLDWSCLAYCLMDNHFHILIRAGKSTVPRGLQSFKGAHARRFNRVHHLRGHLFETNPGPRVIRNETYLFTALKYVLLNPVGAGCCTDPGGWEWSSFRGTVVEGAGPDWFDPTAVLSMFREDRESARRRFREFVMAKG